MQNSYLLFFSFIISMYHLATPVECSHVGDKGGSVTYRWHLKA